MATRDATAGPSPRSAIAFELSIGTTDTPSGASWVRAAAISRAPLLSRPTMRVACESTSIRASTWRTRLTLSAKSETRIELREAVIDPSWLIIGRNVSTAAAGWIWRTRKISVTKLLARARRPIGAVDAAPEIGWILSAPPATGTATKPLARMVDRNSSKYSDCDKGRSVTTETRPWTLGSMMKVRPVTRDASWMKARISASRRLSTFCAKTGETGAQAKARAIRALFTGSTSHAKARPGRPDRPSHWLRHSGRSQRRTCSSDVTRWPLTATMTSPAAKPAAAKARPPSPPGLTTMPLTRPLLVRGTKLIGWAGPTGGAGTGGATTTGIGVAGPVAWGIVVTGVPAAWTGPDWSRKICSAVPLRLIVTLSKPTAVSVTPGMTSSPTMKLIWRPSGKAMIAPPCPVARSSRTP